MILLCFFYMMHRHLISFFFFFNDTATTEIYTLSLHDALPICLAELGPPEEEEGQPGQCSGKDEGDDPRSEEHTSELQSRLHLVCRLLLEKKKKKKKKEIRKYEKREKHEDRYDYNK